MCRYRVEQVPVLSPWCRIPNLGECPVEPRGLADGTPLSWISDQGDNLKCFVKRSVSPHYRQNSKKFIVTHRFLNDDANRNRENLPVDGENRRRLIALHAVSVTGAVQAGTVAAGLQDRFLQDHLVHNATVH
jgi:hypothetical protein